LTFAPKDQSFAFISKLIDIDADLNIDGDAIKKLPGKSIFTIEINLALLPCTV
jgi:hypothetical protein